MPSKVISPDELSSMTVLEAQELSRLLEEKWGVSAAAPVAAGREGLAPVEEQTEFAVTLAAVGEKKINVIKEIRTVTGLGLKEAKDLVEAAPKTFIEGLNKDEAQNIKQKLESVGATVIIDGVVEAKNQELERFLYNIVHDYSRVYLGSGDEHLSYIRSRISNAAGEM